MTIENILLLTIIAIALVLFSIEWIAIDIVALGLLASLIITGLLPLDQAFAGFGNDTIVLIVGLLILTASLVRNGVVDLLSQKMMHNAGSNPKQLLGTTMLVVAGLSSFMSNTAATALFIPVVMGFARRLNLHASRLLMPLAFSAILASSVTLVGTSTNIVVSGVLTRYGMSPLGMFELAPVGVPILVVGLVYMALIGVRMIPKREAAEKLTEQFGLRPYLTEVIIPTGSDLIGKTLKEAALGRNLDLTVLVIVRGKDRFVAPSAELALQENDVLLVEGKPEDILKVKNTSGIEIVADASPSDQDLEADKMQLVEAIILVRSPLLGRTLRGLDLRDKFRIQALAIHRHEGMILHNLNKIPLRLGDVLLIQGEHDDIMSLERNNIIRVIGTVAHNRPNTRRSGIAIGIFAGVIGLASLNILPLALAVLMGTFFAFLSRCITPEEAYREVEWKLIILIGSMLAFGAAMEHTGTAKYLAEQLVNVTGNLNPLILLSGFFVLTLILTQPMSNQAAAMVVLPVAIQSAMQLGLNPRTFAVMIALGASTSFITPLEPACMMVYSLGRYRFLDFIKVGSLLTIFIYLIAILLVPVFWPL